ncbi:hypothetical protein BKI52_02700 [marine bacterium AO1-C]|nr:hypothetical protein BKI52_02700 [marine bacterium AO1-C]
MAGIAGLVGNVLGGVANIFSEKARTKTAEVNRDIIGIQGRNTVLALQEQQKIERVRLQGDMFENLTKARLADNQVQIAQINSASKMQLYMVFGILGLIVILKKR